MKVTFIIPPVLSGKREVERVFGCTYGLYPIPNIFFLYIATVFLEKGHNVSYVDGPILKWSKKSFLDSIKHNESQVYLFYTVNLAKDTDLAAAAYIKANNPDAWIIFIGPSPTYAPLDYLCHDKSIVISGEPEDTATELAAILPMVLKNEFDSLLGIKGISYRINGKVVENKFREPINDIDRLAFPARNLVKNDRYYNPKLGLIPFTVLLTSRGCPFRCRYCVPNSQSFARELAYRAQYKGYGKPKVSIRSYENVYSELESLKKEGYKAISIIDDQFIWDRNREIKIAQAMGRLGFRWGCLSRADRITEDIAKAFGENNCQYVDIGVESFSQEILDDINKDTTVEKMCEGIGYLKKYSVPVKLNILFGASAKESVESMRNTLKFVRDLEVDSVMVGICNPFPGTEFWDIAKQNNWLLSPEYKPVDVQKESTIAYSHLPAEILEKEVKRANLEFFLNPGFFLKHIARIKTPYTILQDAKALFKKLTRP